MKTSLQWLDELLPGEREQKLAAPAVADALLHAGLPVESIEPAGDDTVLDVEVTSNRSDCLCHWGIARELSALLGRPLSLPTVNADEDAEPAGKSVSVAIEAKNLCPLYTARLIRGVRIGPSPDWLAHRLTAIGIRPINNVVDVTNYVMLEMGQPLHAFDFSHIGGRQIIVRHAVRGESIIAIDGRKRDLSPEMLVIADASRPVALAGVMGGLESEVSATTTNILLESARFDALSVRKTARELNLRSESSYRFERGIAANLPPAAAVRAAQLILQTAGGQLLAGSVQAGETIAEPIKLSLRLTYMRRVLGIDLPANEVMDAFRRLSLQPVSRDGHIDVTVPSHRLDIRQEIDLVEEAARVLGYSKIPEQHEIHFHPAPRDMDAVTTQTVCQTLVAGGYFEAVTFSFVSDGLQTAFGSSRLRADERVRKADAHLRPSLLPGLLEAVHLNQTNGTAGAKLFEIGSVFRIDDGGQLDEQRKLGFVGGEDLRHVRGMIEALVNKLDADRPLRVEPAAHPGFAPTACGRVIWGDQPIGFIGLIDPAISGKLDLRHPPAAAELDWPALLSGSRHVPRLKELPRFPAIRRDLSLIVPETLRFSQIQSLLEQLGMADLESVEFVTTYRGKPLAPGTKSVTITLVFRSATATLTSEAVESAVGRAVSAAGEKLGATLRV